MFWRAFRRRPTHSWRLTFLHEQGSAHTPSATPSSPACCCWRRWPSPGSCSAGCLNGSAAASVATFFSCPHVARLFRAGHRLERAGDGHRARPDHGPRLPLALGPRPVFRRARGALHPEHPRGEHRVQYGETDRRHVLQPAPQPVFQGRARRVSTPGCRTIGFLTGKVRGERGDGRATASGPSSFPTTPNPTSGFLLLVPEAISSNWRCRSATA